MLPIRHMLITHRHGTVLTPDRLPVCRTLHLVDLENLAGGADFTAVQAAALRTAYEHVVGIGPDDLVIVATSHYAAPVAWFAWPHARRLTRSGQDGADLALLDVLASERVTERFSAVIVASGDGIFAEASASIQAAGCQVTVVSRPQALSRRLAFAVRDQISLNVIDLAVSARALRSAA
jgi:hypothetical protein